MASGFSFAVLGPVRGWLEGSEVDLGSPQQRAVLAVLLLRAGAQVSAEDLVDTLWPEDPPKSAVGTIRTYVYRLRRLLGGEELIGSAGGAYVFAPPGDALDVSRFRRSVERARRARAEGDVALAARYLEEGLGLWHGAALAGIPGRFAETQRVLLEELRLAATEDAMGDGLALGRHADLIAGLVALAGEHPYRERLRVLLMLALYRAGRQAEALAVFDEVRRLFNAELGIDPGPQLRDLQLRILNADPALMEVPAAERPPAISPMADGPGAGSGARPARREPAAVGNGGAAAPAGEPGALRVPPAQLPRDLPTFAGRRADVDFVLAGFADEPGTASVTVIAGMAGVGKTTLAVRAAHLLADRFPDGQLYVDLRGFDRTGMAVSSHDAIRQLLEGLDVPPDRIPAEAGARTGLYRSLLAGRRILVVLDNAHSAEQVRPLLPGASGCRVLVTSRDQMRALIAIEGARLVGLSPLSRADAREALARRLGAPRLDAESEAVERLITLCAGLPLTLSIVAARAAIRATHSLSSIAAELTRAGSRLGALADADSAADVRASLSLSYHALSPGAALLLRLSSLHPGAEVSLDALASLAGISAAQATTELDELERLHMMTQPEPGQYASHDVVRAYAAELADADQAPDAAVGRDAARKRMFDHYRQSAHKAMLLLRPFQGPFAVTGLLPGVTVAQFDATVDAFDWCARNYPVLRVILDQTVEHALPEYTWDLAWALDPFLDRQARWRELVTVHHAALAAAEKLVDPALTAQSHMNLGDAFRLLRDPQRATEHLQIAQRLYTELGDLAGQARNLGLLAVMSQTVDLPEQAMAYTVRALELSRQIHDHELEAIGLNNLGHKYSISGDHATAIDSVRRALDLFEKIGKVSYRADVLLTLGQCHCRAGDSKLAVAQLAEAASIFHAERNPYQEAYALRWIAIAQHQAGNMASARRAWQRALPILSDLGDDLSEFESFVTEDAGTRR